MESGIASKLFSKDSANYDDSKNESDAVFFGSELGEGTKNSAPGSKIKGKRARCEGKIDCYQQPVPHVR